MGFGLIFKLKESYCITLFVYMEREQLSLQNSASFYIEAKVLLGRSN